MKKLMLCIVWMMVAKLVSFAQPPQIEWTHTYGGSDYDEAYSVQQTTDGGYIIVGGTVSFGVQVPDFYMVKTDSQGDTLWTKNYGRNYYDVAYSVYQTLDGGYIVAGVTEPAQDIGDFYLVRTNSQGDSLWTRTYGGVANERAYSVQQTNDGGFIVAGYTYSFGFGELDAYLVKTNSQGDTLWTRTYGGISYDLAFSVQQTTDGGYIIAGYTFSFGAGEYDFYLVKTNSQGDTLWTRTYGGVSCEEAFSVQQTTDGGYIIAGYTTSYGAGEWDIYLVKTNTQGDTLWTHTYGGNSLDWANSVHQTADDGYIIAGYTNSFGVESDKCYLIKTNSLGDTLWTLIYGSGINDIASSVQQTTDGGYIVAGWTVSSESLADFYVTKTAPDISLVPPSPNGTIPEAYTLYSPYPNPFNPTTTIHYEIPITSQVQIVIYNILGQQEVTLINQTQNAGTYSTIWNAGDFPSGIYFCRLVAPNFQSLQKMVLIK